MCYSKLWTTRSSLSFNSSSAACSILDIKFIRCTHKNNVHWIEKWVLRYAEVILLPSKVQTVSVTNINNNQLSRIESNIWATSSRFRMWLCTPDSTLLAIKEPNWIANCINLAEMNLYIFVSTHTHTDTRLEKRNSRNEFKRFERNENGTFQSRIQIKYLQLISSFWLFNAVGGVKLKLNHRHIYSISVQCKWNDMLSDTSMFHIKYYSIQCWNCFWVCWCFSLFFSLFNCDMTLWSNV